MGNSPCPPEVLAVIRPLLALAAPSFLPLVGCDTPAGADPPAAAVAAAADPYAGVADELAADGMAFVPGGSFTMGTADPPRLHGDESPARRVSLDPFYIDKTEVTNAEFARFVGATGYVTTAERPITREDLAGQAPPEFLASMPDGGLPPASVCMSGSFDPALAGRIGENPALVYAAGIWKAEPGADWRRPTGLNSSIEGKDDYPVVHISHDDALAYAAWAGKALPTEAQWEYAARGGPAANGSEYPWGNEKTPGGEHRANIYQGRFPFEDRGEDGYPGSAPVASFPPNELGLYDMSGNVWEWCRDWYRGDYYSTAPDANPPGPADSFDPAEPNVPKRVQRGGSFLCSDNYCTGYRAASRMKGDPKTGSFHCGFRCVVDDPAAWATAPARGYAAGNDSPAADGADQ